MCAWIHECALYCDVFLYTARFYDQLDCLHIHISFKVVCVCVRVLSPVCLCLAAAAVAVGGAGCSMSDRSGMCVSALSCWTWAVHGEGQNSHTSHTYATKEPSKIIQFMWCVLGVQRSWGSWSNGGVSSLSTRHFLRLPWSTSVHCTHTMQESEPSTGDTRHLRIWCSVWSLSAWVKLLKCTFIYLFASYMLLSKMT